MSWLNTNYILRAGVLSVLLLLPGLMSATCKRDTITQVSDLEFKPFEHTL